MFLFIWTSAAPHCFFAVAFSKEVLSEEMNFSLYRGNLHKVPDVPRRWPLSKPSMSLPVFQKAIAKRREAVHRLQKNRKCQGQLVSDALANGELGQEHCEGEAVDGMDYSGDKASSHDEDGAKDGEEHGRKRKREDSEALVGMETEGDDIKAEEDLCRVRERKPRISSETDTMIVEGMPLDALDDMDCDYASQPHRMSDTRGEEGVILQAEDADVTHGLGDAKGVENGTATEESNKEKEAERLEAPRTPAAKDEECIKPTERVTAGLDGCATPCVLTTQESSGGTCKAKRKAELVEKLKQLQETKHQLVQILKQVLISEEESKRKGQGLSQYPAAYPTVGTMDQPLDQRTGSDLHISADLEEGELEYTRNPGQPIVASSHSSDFSIAHPPPMGATLGRHYNNSQQLNKL